MKTKDFIQTIELLKGKRELPAVFKEMQEIINGAGGESPYLPLLLNGLSNKNKPEKPVFKAVDFCFDKDYYRQDFSGQMIDCLSILVESNLDVSNRELESELRSLIAKLQTKYNFAPDVDWSDRMKTWIMCTKIWLVARYYLADISVPQIRATLMEKHENICEVTDNAGSIVVILKESVRALVADESKEAHAAASEKAKQTRLFREEIAKECHKIIKQNDELDFWKSDNVNVDFGDKVDLDRYIKKYGKEGLSQMVQSDWDHGGCLY
jgi:hypothetical protein